MLTNFWRVFKSPPPPEQKYRPSKQNLRSKKSVFAPHVTFAPHGQPPVFFKFFFLPGLANILLAAGEFDQIRFWLCQGIRLLRYMQTGADGQFMVKKGLMDTTATESCVNKLWEYQWVSFIVGVVSWQLLLSMSHIFLSEPKSWF